MLTSLILALTLASQPQPDQAPPDTADPAARRATTALGDIKLREEDFRMTVPVMINGAGPFRFIVDSGATRTVISHELATMLGLPAGDPVRVNSVSGAISTPSVLIAKLALGTLPAQAVVAPVLEQWNLGAVGILGIDVLQDREIVLDVKNNRMQVLPAGRANPPASENEIVVTARMKLGQLVLADADASGQRVYAVVDTGASETLGNDVLREKLVRRRHAAVQVIPFTDVTGTQVQAAFAPVSDIRIGGMLMHNGVLGFCDAQAFRYFGLGDKPSMLLGMDMLRRFRKVTIDFRHRTVRFAMPSVATEASVLLTSSAQTR